LSNQHSIIIVAAVADNGIIGANNAIPWTLPSDLKHFRSITIGRPIIMGRKTFESIGRPLPGRTNIVITRNPRFMAPGIVPALSFAEALEVASADADSRDVSEIAIIGGGRVYEHALDFADRLFITEVHASPKGDAMFPKLETNVWREVKREQGVRSAGDDHDFSFVSYVRL